MIEVSGFKKNSEHEDTNDYCYYVCVAVTFVFLSLIFFDAASALPRLKKDDALVSLCCSVSQAIS